MSLSISLVPQHPNQEISVQLLSTLFGNNWWEFISDGAAPAGPGSIIAQLFQTIDVALLLYVSAIIIYTQLVGGMQTAHEGIPLGKRYHSVWSVIRGPAAWFLLFPLPWAKGMAMIQVILLTATYWGIGVADDVWSAFVQDIPKYGGTLIPYQGDVQKETQFAEKALIVDATQSYLSTRGGYPLKTKWIWLGDIYSGTYVLGAVPQKNNPNGDIDYNLGTISFKCSSDMKSNDAPSNSWLGSLWSDTVQTGKDLVEMVQGEPEQTAQNNPACIAEMNNITQTLKSYVPVVEKIINMNPQANGGPPSGASVASAISNYVNLQNNAYTDLMETENSKYKTQLEKFAKTASDLGWASSAYYWWTMENINAEAQANAKNLHAIVKLPKKSAVEGIVGKLYEPYIDAVNGLLQKFQSELNEEEANSKNAQNVAKIDAPNNGNSTGIFSFMDSSNGDSYFGKRLMELPGDFSSGDPLADVANFGRKVKHWGVGIATTSALAKFGAGAVKVIGGAAGGILGSATDEVDGPTGTVGGAILGSKLASSVIGTITSIASALGKLAFPVGVMLIIEGATLQYVFPAIPGVIMMIAIVGWLFLVLEMFVASVLWAAAHVYAEGEGFAPPQAQYGYAAVLGVLFRPLLLTLGFIFAFFVMDIGGWFVGKALQVYLTGMGGTQIGAIGFGAMMAVIITTIFLFIKTVLKLITHLADRAPQWIGGHSGQGLGESELGTSAVQAAGGGVNKYGMYAADKAGVAVDSIAAGMAASSADEEKKSRDTKRTAEAVNPGKAADTGKGTEEPEKKESPDK